MTEQENQDKNKIVNELNTIISNICDGEHSCRRRKCQDCKLDYIADYVLRKEEEVRKECDKNAYNVWKGMFGLKEKAIREEVRKEILGKVFSLANSPKYLKFYSVNKYSFGYDFTFIAIQDLKELIKDEFGVEV